MSAERGSPDMTPLQQATITIDISVDDRQEATVTVTSRPMVPALNLADLLEKIVAEIRAGRLDSLKIRDVGGAQ